MRTEQLTTTTGLKILAHLTEADWAYEGQDPDPIWKFSDPEARREVTGEEGYCTITFFTIPELRTALDDSGEVFHLSRKVAVDVGQIMKLAR